MECVNRSKNVKACVCSYPSCSRKGLCCECVQYHLSHREVPGCFFPSDAEKTYDRSLEHFIRIQSSKLK